MPEEFTQSLQPGVLSQRSVHQFYLLPSLTISLGSIRTHDWFCLGYSLAPLLQIGTGPILLRALSQLLAEYSYHTSGTAKQGLQAFMAKEKGSVDFSRWKSEQNPVITQDSLKGSLHRTSHGVYYDLLQTPNVPDCLDYNRIVCSLCTVMEQIYKKFLEESWFLPQNTHPTTSSSVNSTAAILTQAIQDIDTEFKHIFFGLISRNITELALNHVRESTDSVRTLKASTTKTLPAMLGATTPSKSNAPS